MDEVVDDDEVLASWKTLDVHDDDDIEHSGNSTHHAAHSHHRHLGHAIHGGDGGASISTDADNDVEDDFAALAYAHHARMEAAAERPPQHAYVQLSASDLEQPQQQHQQQQQQHDSLTARQPHTHTPMQQRLKRKNFSKKLQLLSLQRYAQFATTHNKLPDKTECQRLLLESYGEFLKAGGAPDEPQLTHQEFLKLIRNRRREMYVRAHRLGVGSSASANSGAAATASATGKRKLPLERAKIYELVEVIDQTREQSGRAATNGSERHSHLHSHSRHHVHTSASRLSLTQRSGEHHAAKRSHGDSAPSQPSEPLHTDALPSVLPTPLSTSTPVPPQQSQPLPMDPNEQLLAIFALQQETLAVQREITERLKAIRDHRYLHDPMEPSSASV